MEASHRFQTAYDRNQILVTLGCVGIVSCLVGALVSVVSGAGWTPWFLFGKSRYLSTLMRWHGVPVELVALWWFAIVTVVSARRRKSRRELAENIVLVSSVPIAALCAWMALSVNPINVPAVAAAISAAVILVVSADTPFAVTRVVRGFRATLADSQSRMVIAGVLFGIVLSFQAARLPVQAVAPSDAQAASFRTWYAAARQPAHPGAQADISILVFTDYMCPYCGTTVPSAEAAISRARENAKAFAATFEVRDYPLDLECNRAIKTAVHPGACLMAAAVRFVRKERGEVAAREFGNWCYRGIDGRLGAEHVWTRLSEMSLVEAFRAAYDQMMTEVRNDVEDAIRLGVTGTPKFFINGVGLPGSQFFFEAMSVEHSLHGGVATEPRR